MNKNKAHITLLSGTLALMGMVIGAGIFFKPTAVLTNVPNVPISILVWAVSGLIAICGGLTVAEVGVQFPDSGGIITYLENIFGKRLAFIAGWIQMILYYPGNIAGIAIIFATQLVNLVGWQEQTKMWIALILVTLMMISNLLSTKNSVRLQNVTTVLKVIPIIVIIILSIFYQRPAVASTVTQHSSSVSLSGFGLALLATLFAFDGWLNIGNLASEMKNPQRDLPKMIALGLGFVTTVYILINVAYLVVATPYELMNTPTPAAYVADKLLSGIGGKFITLGILISVFGAENGYVMAGIRVPEALANRQWLPFKAHQRLNERAAGILLMYLVSVLMIISGSFDLLTNLGVFAIWLCTVLVFIGVFKLRKMRPNKVRAYSVPLYPIVPIIAIGSGLFILINTLVAQTGVALSALAVMLGIYLLSLKILK